MRPRLFVLSCFLVSPSGRGGPHRARHLLLRLCGRSSQACWVSKCQLMSCRRPVALSTVGLLVPLGPRSPFSCWLLAGLLSEAIASLRASVLTLRSGCSTPLPARLFRLRCGDFLTHGGHPRSKSYPPTSGGGRFWASPHCGRNLLV